MKNVKNLFVRISTSSLCFMACLFASMLCQGKIYEPKVPEKLSQNK